jgi:hypothetical protein
VEAASARTAPAARARTMRLSGIDQRAADLGRFTRSLQPFVRV